MTATLRLNHMSLLVRSLNDSSKLISARLNEFLRRT
jgi:hypothetical protein